jgi:hypothetical protein
MHFRRLWNDSNKSIEIAPLPGRSVNLVALGIAKIKHKVHGSAVNLSDVQIVCDIKSVRRHGRVTDVELPEILLNDQIVCQHIRGGPAHTITVRELSVKASQKGAK